MLRLFVALAFLFTTCTSAIEAVLPLTDQWVVLVVSTQADVVAKIDELSGGKMAPEVARWVATKDTPHPDWGAKKRMLAIRDQYIVEARMAVEPPLDDPCTYTPTPVRVGRCLVGLGDAITMGGPDVEYASYCYLQLPQPMMEGETYTFTALGKSAQLTWAPDKTISRAIKVNQVGYLSDAPHYAYVGCDLYGIGPLEINAQQFDLVDAMTGAVVYTGKVELRDKNSQTKSGRLLTGEYIYSLDFSDYHTPGSYYVRVPGVGRSWGFEIGPRIYGDVFYTAGRGLYHQRCGTALTSQYTAWPRPKCHMGKLATCDLLCFPPNFTTKPKPYERFDIVGGSMTGATHAAAPGGWHDAADWDRYNYHYIDIFDLLYAYELAPSTFTDGQLNIPESGNGIPDILDEAAYGLMVWRSTMTSKGGCSGWVETTTHPRIDQDVTYAIGQPTRWDSLMFAAAAAQMAEYTRPFDKTVSERWLWYARKVFDYGADPANSLGEATLHAKSNRGTGNPYTVTWQEEEKFITPFLAHAAARMYRATGQDKYKAVFEATGGVGITPCAWPWTPKDYSPWLVYGTLPMLDPTARQVLIQKAYLDYADKLVGYIDAMPYRCTWPVKQDFWMAWGASDMTNYGRLLLIAYNLTKDTKYRDAATLNFDYMLGANPMGMSWTTGIGQVYPISIQHEVSNTDGIDEPVPGITIYGVTGGMYKQLRETVWQSNGVDFGTPEVPVWRSWSANQKYNTGQCEFTVSETMSSTILCAALLTGPGYMPDEATKARRPKPKAELYGYHYLP